MSAPAFPDPAGHWNQRFRADGYIFGTEPNRYLERRAELLTRGGRVLSVADGEGRNSVFLARQGLRVDAFDIAELGVEKARKLAAASNVHVNYAVADGDRLAWPAALYDGVVAIFIQFAAPDLRARLFANMVRCLKPGGVLILQGYTPKQLEYRTGGPSQVDHLYTPEMLREAFVPTLEILELTEYEDELAEGTHHAGRSALIGMVGRKR